MAEKMGRRYGVFFIILFLLGIGAFATFVVPGFFFPEIDTVSMPQYFDEGSVSSASVSGNTKVGSLDNNGYVLAINDGAFENGSSVTLKVLSAQERVEAVQTIHKMDGKQAFNVVGSIVELTADKYDRKYFAKPVVLQMKIPSENIVVNELGYYTAAYFNEELDKWIYYSPDFVDPETGIMQVTLEHFSWGGFFKKTPEEAKNDFLDEYCTMQARMEFNEQKAAEALVPWISENLNKLNLTQEATKEFANMMASEIAGDLDKSHVARKQKEGQKVNAADEFGYAETAVTVAQSAFEALEDGDYDKFAENMKNYFSVKTMNYILENNKKEIPLVEELISSSNSFAKAAGLAAGNDYRGAIEEFDNAVLGWVPGSEDFINSAVYIGEGDYKEAVKAFEEGLFEWVPKKDMIKTAAHFITASCQSAVWNFKANAIEDLYQSYKDANGDDLTFDIIRTTRIGAGTERLYTVDGIAQICESYGWSEHDFDRLKPEQQEIFRKRAADGLRDYFKTRLASEKRAAEIRIDEKDFIDRISNELLSRASYQSFFGEKRARDFDTKERLKLIFEIRQGLKGYFDEKKMKNSGTNWSEIMIEFVKEIDIHGIKDGYHVFFENMRNWGVLKDVYSKPNNQPKNDNLPKKDCNPGDPFCVDTGSIGKQEKTDTDKKQNRDIPTISDIEGTYHVSIAETKDVYYNLKDYSKEYYYTMTIRNISDNQIELNIYHKYQAYPVSNISDNVYKNTDVVKYKEEYYEFLIYTGSYKEDGTLSLKLKENKSKRRNIGMFNSVSWLTNAMTLKLSGKKGSVVMSEVRTTGKERKTTISIQGEYVNKWVDGDKLMEMTRTPEWILRLDGKIYKSTDAVMDEDQFKVFDKKRKDEEYKEYVNGRK